VDFTPEDLIQHRLRNRKTLMNQIRFVCNDSDKKGVHVKSTLNDTEKLDGRTDETISWTDEDLIAIKNCLDRPTEILVESVRLPEGRQAIFSPSRQATFKLTSRDISEVHSCKSLILGPGESCMLRSSQWHPQAGGGAVIPV